MPQIFTTFEEVSYQDSGKIELRKEQLEAIKEAKTRFKQKAGNKFLWNAKMRFGKTVCALQLAKELDYRRILIVTHRPTVNKEWLEAYEERFADVKAQYSYGTKSDTQSEGTDFYTLKKKIEDVSGSHFLFFASMQYLRRSNIVGGDNDEQLKKDIMQYDWDLVIVDEAHEGTRTELGQKVLEYLDHKEHMENNEKNTRMLHLSGTPFNLYEDFKDKEIYTWDYVDEQEAKKAWPNVPNNEGKPAPKENVGKPNPYASLPHMNILTFDMKETFDKFLEEGGTFKFKDFFRTKTGSDVPAEERGKFVHEDEVREFIAKLRGKDDDNNFPFSNDEFRKAFRHTLWIVPGVKEAKALKNLLKQDKVFCKFDVINVAGNNDDEQKDGALDAVLKAITDLPDQTRTITLSCGKLTTGTTVKPWTAVLYLKGSEDTKAATYMQTIFRVQSPCVMGNKMKTECYVFDFDYQRTLKVVAETAKYSTKAKRVSGSEDVKELTQDELDKKNMKAFLECCNVKPLVPFIEDGVRMTEFNIESIFKRLEQVYVDRLVTSGFNDKCLYDMKELNKIDKSIIDNIGEHGGAADHIDGDKRKKGVGEAIDANNLTEEQKKAIEEAKRKLRAEIEAKRKEKWDALTQEEQDRILEERARKALEKQEFKDRVSNIRGISLRIPLLMFGGADKGKTTEPLTVDNFTRLITDESWKEFMPKDISKDDFNKIRKVFKATRFEEAGKKYRALAKEADNMHITDRMERITLIHSWFKNPDKETVLTPWSVVNMHLNTALGGYTFFDPKDYKSPIMKDVTRVDDNGNEFTEAIESNEPIFTSRGEITTEVFSNYDAGKDAIQTRILEINSKTGLYPLYMAYTLYRMQMDAYIREKAYDDVDNLSVEEEQATWDNVIRNNIFVICNTKMAAQITYRTLMGFREEEQGLHHIKTTQLVKQASNDRERATLISNLQSGSFWGVKDTKMTFNAVVGNPPYQGSARVQLYPTFYLLAIQLGNNVSLIFPTGWQKPCAPTAKGLFKMNNQETKADKQIVYLDNRHNVFPGISGANEINIVLWKRGYDNGLNGKQLVYTDGQNPEQVQLQWIQSNEGKPLEIQTAAEAVKKIEGEDFKRVSDMVSSKDPFGIPTDLFTNPNKYGKSLNDFKEAKQNESDIRIFGGIEHKRAERYVSSDFPVKENPTLAQYKIFVPWAWGNMDEKAGLGGAYADIIIAEKNDVCSMTYNTCGIFDSYETAKKQAKYMMTTFFRGLLFNSKVVKTSSKMAYSSIPIQDFTEEWWEETIEFIDKKLFEKYKIQDLYDFFKKNIQIRNEGNICNFR